MRILIVGSGGREHALAWWCRRGREDVELIVAPGNAGTAELADNVAVDATDAVGIARLAVERHVDLVVIGPDAAAAAGVADACVASGIVVFGPSAAAARIESSKMFAKRLMDDAGIATARWMAGGGADLPRLRAFVDDLDGRCVVKADGLALGKGVTVCSSTDDADRALSECFETGRFGDAGRLVVIEERLIGDELSVFGISDGLRIRALPPARDHKRAGDGDTGPNTGGMGAVSPAPGVADDIVNNVADSVLQPCIDALRERGTPFVGCLYAGLMLTADGVRVLEFNARFGDPEAQVVLPLVEESGVELLHAAATGDIAPGRVRAANASAAGIVAAAAGYPGSPRTGDEISGLRDLNSDALVFHAGTRRDENGILRTAGGRVLCVVTRALTLESARATAYENLSRVHFDGMQFRHDIGHAGGEPPAFPPDKEAMRGASPPHSPQIKMSSSTDRGLAGAKPPRVGIVVGSESDLPVMRKTGEVLDGYGIGWEIGVMSAHRSSELVREYALAAIDRGLRVLVAGAGAAAALPGVLASMTTLPVIGVPLAATPLAGFDSLLSIVQMPPGIPVATVAVGDMGARNAGHLAAEIIGLSNDEVAAAVVRERAKMRDKAQPPEGFVVGGAASHD